MPSPRSFCKPQKTTTPKGTKTGDILSEILSCRLLDLCNRCKDHDVFEAKGNRIYEEFVFKRDFIEKIQDYILQTIRLL